MKKKEVEKEAKKLLKVIKVYGFLLKSIFF